MPSFIVASGIEAKRKIKLVTVTVKVRLRVYVPSVAWIVTEKTPADVRVVIQLNSPVAVLNVVSSAAGNVAVIEYVRVPPPF